MTSPSDNKTNQNLFIFSSLIYKSKNPPPLKMGIFFKGHSYHRFLQLRKMFPLPIPSTLSGYFWHN